MPVARNACGFIYNGLPHTYEAVEKCGLTHIRASYNCY